MNVALVMAAALLVALARDPQALLTPPMVLEDGAVFFAYFYDASGIAPLFHFYAGYIPFLTNAAAYAVSRFPTLWQPHLMALIPLAASSAAFGLFAAPMFRRIVESDLQRAIVGLGLAAFPLGNFAKIGLTSYLQWSLMLVLCLIVLSGTRIAVNSLRGLALTAFLAAVIWTNPVAMIALPLFAFEACRLRSTDPWMAFSYGVLILAGVLYGLLGYDRMSTAIDLGQAIINGIRAVLERGVFETAFGSTARMSMLSGGGFLWMDAAAILTIAAVVVALLPRLRQNSEFRGFALKAAYLGVAATFMSAMIRSTALDSPWGRRYSYTAAVLFAVLALIAVTDVLARLLAARLYKVLGACVAVLAAGLAVGNWQNNYLYRVQAGEWPALRAFLGTVVDAERASREQTLSLDRGRWTIVVHTHAR
jgi:hypothetical protein